MKFSLNPVHDIYIIICLMQFSRREALNVSMKIISSFENQSLNDRRPLISIRTKGLNHHRQQFICRFGSQLYHQTFHSCQAMYSSNLYKTSYDQIKTLHEILQFTICLIFLSVSMT